MEWFLGIDPLGVFVAVGKVQSVPHLHFCQPIVLMDPWLLWRESYADSRENFRRHFLL